MEIKKWQNIFSKIKNETRFLSMSKLTAYRCKRGYNV